MKRFIYMLCVILTLGFITTGVATYTPVSAKTIKVDSSKPKKVKLTGKVTSKEGYEGVKIYYLKFSKKITFKEKSDGYTQKQKTVEVYTGNSKKKKKWDKYLKKHVGKKVTLKGELAIGEYDYVLFLK